MFNKEGEDVNAYYIPKNCHAMCTFCVCVSKDQKWTQTDTKETLHPVTTHQPPPITRHKETFFGLKWKVWPNKYSFTLLIWHWFCLDQNIYQQFYFLVIYKEAKILLLWSLSLSLLLCLIPPSLVCLISPSLVCLSDLYLFCLSVWYLPPICLFFALKWKHVVSKIKLILWGKKSFL